MGHFDPKALSKPHFFTFGSINRLLAISFRTSMSGTPAESMGYSPHSGWHSLLLQCTTQSPEAIGRIGD